MGRTVEHGYPCVLLRWRHPLKSTSPKLVLVIAMVTPTPAGASDLAVRGLQDVLFSL